MDYTTADQRTNEKNTGDAVAPDEIEIGPEQAVTEQALNPDYLVTRFDEFEPIMAEIQEKADAHEVVDDASSGQCAEMATQARKVMNEIEKKRKSVLAPYQAVTGAVNSCCKSIKDRLLSVQRLLEGKNQPYLIEQERQRREAEEAARKEAERQRREAEAARKAAEKKNEPAPEVVEPVAVAVAPPAETKLKSEHGTQGVVTEWVWEILDLQALPSPCFQSRAKQIEGAVTPWINAQVKAGVREIPGVRVFQKQVVKTRAR